MKKILITTTALFLIIFTKAMAFTPYFQDTDEHWAEHYTEILRKTDILKGDNLKSEPQNFITREEFCALIVRSFYEVDTYKAENHFIDVDKDNIFAQYISIAYENGIITGTSHNTFSPRKNITREEIAIIVSRLNLLENTISKIKFNDVNKNYQYYDEISICVSNNIINGYTDNTFKPKHNATRAEAAAMIVRVMENAKYNNSKIDEFAVQALNSDFSDKDFIRKNSIGQAKYDIDYINKINITPQNKIYFTADTTQYIHKGMISYITFKGKGIVNKKNINISVEYGVINKNNIYYIFDRNIDFKTDNKINLTWEVNTKPPSYSPSGLTHVSPSVFEISNDYSNGKKININDENINLYDRISNSYAEYASSNGYDVWAMFKTDFNPVTANLFFNNDIAENNTIKYIANKCIEFDIKGINLDFENMYKSDKEKFYTFAHHLELILHEIGVIISADITRYEKSSSNWSMCYDRNKLNEYCDYIMLMAYDQYYAGSKTPGPVAGLGWTEDSVELTLKEIDNEKLILGVPFYTRYWESVNNNVVSTKAISMETAIRLIKENNAKLVYVEKDKQHKAYWNDNEKDYSFWFETAETVGKRVDIANKYNLAGIASWRRGFETADVWDEINKELNE